MLKEFKTLLPLVRQHLPYYFAGLICLVFTNAGELYIPQLLKKAVDAMAYSSFSISDVRQISLIITGIAAVIAVSRFGWRFFIHGASRRIENRMRIKLFSHLLTLSPSFYSGIKTGDIMARATNDMNAIRMATGIAFVAFMDGMFLSVAILIILFSSYPYLTLITIAPLPLITLMILFAGKEVGRRFRKVQEGFSGLSEKAQEIISGIRVVKTLVRESHVEELFRKTNEEYINRSMKLVRLWGFFFPFISFISGLTILLLLVFGGTGVIENRYSAGDFAAFMSYLAMLQWPVIGMGFTVNMLQRGAASLSRINAILDEKPDITSPPAKISDKAGTPSGSIRVENLSFSYRGKNRAGCGESSAPEDSTPEDSTLSNISFSLEAGETLGILGRTGSGKTTLVRLLPRLLDPPPGAIFIGGTDIRNYRLQRLRRAFALVPQDTFLFSASIRDNITFGKPSASAEAAAAAADISTISREINLFPSGWETQAGERGVTLSGGQKQRIALSRALLTDAEYIILDDAMSAVDTETEEIILSRFFTARKGRTNIIISHRVSTLQRADRIIVLDRGRLVQEGNHRDLINTEGLYREIYILQQAERRNF